MSKAHSSIFYLSGLGAILVATVPLVFGLLGSTFTTTYPPTGGVVHQVTAFGNPALFWLAIGMYVVGGIIAFVGYIGALIKLEALWDSAFLSKRSIFSCPGYPGLSGS